MLLSKIIEGRKTVYSRGASSDDIRLSSRYIYDIFLDNRNRVISQKKNKKQFIADYNYEVINKVELKTIQPGEYPVLFFNGDYVLKKSKEKLPEALSYEKGLMVDWILNPDNKEIPLQDKRRVKYQGSNRYVKQDSVAIIEDGYLYLATKNYIDEVSIKFVAYNPLELRLKGCISAMEVDFPLQGSERDAVLQMTDQEIMGAFSTNREDRQNDSKEQANVYQKPKDDKD